MNLSQHRLKLLLDVVFFLSVASWGLLFPRELCLMLALDMRIDALLALAGLLD